MYIATVPRNLRGGVFSERSRRRLRWTIFALGILAALQLRAQSVIEFPLPGSRLAYGIAAGLAGACGIPATARAVAINSAVTQSGGLGHLSVYPGGSPLPLVSFINYSAGQTRANNGVLSLGSGGFVVVHCGQSSGTVI